MNFSFFCDRFWLARDVPLQLLEAQSSDGSTSMFVTRFLHNKVTFFASNTARCYLSYLSPDYIAQAITIFGLALFLLGLWYLASRKKFFILALVLLAPLLPLFELPPNETIQGIVLYGAYLLTALFGLLEIFIGLRAVYLRLRRRK